MATGQLVGRASRAAHFDLGTYQESACHSLAWCSTGERSSRHVRSRSPARSVSPMFRTPDRCRVGPSGREQGRSHVRSQLPDTNRSVSPSVETPRVVIGTYVMPELPPQLMCTRLYSRMQKRTPPAARKFALTWHQLLTSDRRRSTDGGVQHVRTEFERDYDRLLFSAPVRRLADKTQVFPLERNDSVRTRLTHSHEVANVARSIATDLAFNHDLGIAADLQPTRNLPALLAAIGLVHDLGNPPFGHQGEQAIQAWFRDHTTDVFDTAPELTDAMRYDFLRFEGNAQTFRIVSRLQILSDDTGLNLAYGTLAALLKYTVASDRADKASANASARKPGYFSSEVDIVQEVRQRTGLREGVRHPLTYVMEACDDICYTVVDAEDAVKKGLASYPDLREHVAMGAAGSPETRAQRALVDDVLGRVDDRRKILLAKPEARKLSPSELNDLTMQYFRVYALSAMVPAVTAVFVSELPELLGGKFNGNLVGRSNAHGLAERLRTFDRRVAYRNREVLALELQGTTVIRGIMDRIWAALQNREDLTTTDRPKFKTPLSAYTYELVSESYRRVFELQTGAATKLPVRYREAQLMTDQIAGMTDTFALTLHEQLLAAERGVDAPAREVAPEPGLGTSRPATAPSEAGAVVLG